MAPRMAPIAQCRREAHLNAPQRKGEKGENVGAHVRPCQLPPSLVQLSLRTLMAFRLTSLHRWGFAFARVKLKRDPCSSPFNGRVEGNCCVESTQGGRLDKRSAIGGCGTSSVQHQRGG